MTIGTFEFTDAGTVPAGAWQFVSGSFTGQDRRDLFGYNSVDGTLWVGENTGLGFVFSTWGSVTPVDGWQFINGDFRGDAREDIVGYHAGNGTVWVGENFARHFFMEEWATVTPASGWQFGAGHFMDHEKHDLFGFHPSNGSLWVGENNGTEFAFQHWQNVDSAGDWQFLADDFTGTGRTDVLGYDRTDGSMWVGENLGSSFDFQRWIFVDPTDDWRFATGRFTGRARADVFGYDAQTGTIWVGENTGDSFAFAQWGTVTPADGWQFVAGIFDADLWSDIACVHSSSGKVEVGHATIRPIEGYCWPLSASPGETIQFMASGEGRAHVRIQRHTSISNDIDSVDVMELDFDAVGQPVPPDPGQFGCAWTESFSVTIPDTWPSGIYAAWISDEANTGCDVTFVVRPALPDRSQVAVLANVNTWLAYNGWGGESKYSGRARTSFLRPNPSSGPAADTHLTRGELWVIGWLASAGYQPDIYSDIDFHNNGCDATQYRCLILSTHPEYWSRQMYANLAAYLDAGGSVLYLGGNGVYENGEYEPGQTGMIFREGVEGGPRVDALFRVLSPAMAERSLLGVATERCCVPGSAYKVELADHPLFAGVRRPDNDTGVQRQVVNGDLFGESGLNTGFGNGKASAWEVDTSAGVGASAVPINCATEESVIRSAILPDGLVVLARGEPDVEGPGAEMILYEHSGGGIVFSVGSLTFGGSLVVDSTIQKLMRNVITRTGVV